MQDRPTQSKINHSQRRGFTLLELMLVFGLLLLIMGFLASSISRATESARQAASQQSVEAIAAAVEQFRLEFGFLPPLVHDGPLVSDNNFRPIDPLTGSPISEEGPLQDGLVDTGYTYQTAVVWSPGHDFDFFRRRDGSNSTDPVALPSGSMWDLNEAWDDRRYSRFSLAFYLTGALPRSVDGVAGSGMSRPLASGGFVNVGYPGAATRDRYEPSVDTNRNGMELNVGYARFIEAAEHNAVPYSDMLSATDIYDLYDPSELDSLVSLVDNFGTAYRYYRWESGRYVGTQLVTETTLDMNIPPVLLDPDQLVLVQNNDANAADIDLTSGNIQLREARFAIVGAGADRLFGTEPIDYLVEQLNQNDPSGDPVAVAQIRKLAMEDNVVSYGK